MVVVYKEDLLDSPDKIIYLLAQKLFLTDQPISRARLAGKLDITSQTLDRYLTRIVTLLDEPLKKGQLTLVESDQGLTLVGNGKITLDEVLLNQLVLSSINYQILEYYYLHGDQTIVHMMIELNLSESSLYRHLRTLNLLLAEFEVQIHNGHLVGSELQIRYLFYRLFRLTYTLAPLDEPQIGFLIQQLQLELNFTFTQTSLKRVRLWLEIAHQRLTVAHHQDQVIPLKIQELYQNNELYGTVARCFKTVFKTKPANKVSFEVESLCVMLIGMSVFNSTTNVVTRFSTIYRANQTTLAKVVREFERAIFKVLGIKADQWPFELTKSVFDLCAQIFCFHGRLDALNETYVKYYQQHYFSRESQFVVEQTIRQLTKTSRPKLNELVRQNSAFLILRLHLIIREFSYQEQHGLTIGLDTTFDIQVDHLLSELIKRPFKDELQVNVVSYQPGDSYDLIVTNYHAHAYDDAKSSYQITNFGTQNDFSQIHDLIKDQFYRHTPIKSVLPPLENS